MDLENKVAIVTGGCSGIGSSIAELFAREGARVMIGDIREDQRTLARINAQGGTVAFVQTDVRKSLEVQNLVDKTIANYGTIDVVCNDAGIELIRPLIQTTEEEWNNVLDTNLKGMFLVSKFALPHLIKKKKGSIINIASQLGLVGLERWGAYCASKGGVIMLTKAMAVEYGTYGIRVNCICPGAIETPMMERELELEKNPEEAKKHFISLHPIGRLGKPEEIAEAGLFLASDRSSFITGSALVVDGGFTTR
ncbi:MAG TPA: SDR family NAD(P)-dependent oxidoreductase [Candidatus Bathyarchaeia archaeon]|nr:SDR family NAD(P)-dependent oxidoreductase [Candidatus Bathyarchaeia archaeon]